MSKQKHQDQGATTINIAKPITETPQGAISPKATGINSKSKSSEAMPFLFGKQNYILMGVGLAFIILGYLLMSGGRSADPNVFDEKAIYSFQRITLAPLLIIIGLCIEGYAIMKKPSEN